MKDIFASLYNKVLSFFHQSETKDSNAKEVACNRLKLVLMQDRTNLSPAIMDRMRRELIDLLSKYLELDRELLDLNFEQEDSQMALMLSIPVLRAKTEEEIMELLRKEDEAKAKEESENDESEEDAEESEEEEKDESEEVEETSEEETEEESTEKEEVKEVKKLEKIDFDKEDEEEVSSTK